MALFSHCCWQVGFEVEASMATPMAIPFITVFGRGGMECPDFDGDLASCGFWGCLGAEIGLAGINVREANDAFTDSSPLSLTDI